MWMRCRIVRDTSIRPTPYGGPAGGFQPEIVATAQPFRIWQEKANLIENGILNLQLTTWKARFPLDVDLELKDRIDFLLNGRDFTVEILTIKGRPFRGFRHGFRHVIATGRSCGLDDVIGPRLHQRSPFV